MLMFISTFSDILGIRLSFEDMEVDHNYKEIENQVITDS